MLRQVALCYISKRSSIIFVLEKNREIHISHIYIYICSLIHYENSFRPYHPMLQIFRVDFEREHVRVLEFMSHSWMPPMIRPGTYVATSYCTGEF